MRKGGRDVGGQRSSRKYGIQVIATVIPHDGQVQELGCEPMSGRTCCQIFWWPQNRGSMGWVLMSGLGKLNNVRFATIHAFSHRNAKEEVHLGTALATTLGPRLPSFASDLAKVLGAMTLLGDSASLMTCEFTGFHRNFNSARVQNNAAEAFARLFDSFTRYSSRRAKR